MFVSGLQVIGQRRQHAAFIGCRIIPVEWRIARAHLLRLERVDYPVAAAQGNGHADEGAVQGDAGMQQGAQHGVEYYALDTADNNIRE